MKRLLSFILICASSPFVVALDLQNTVQKQLEHPVLQGAVWGGLATYTDSPQQPLFSINADMRLTPASTLKLLTTAAALELLGPHHRFETKLYSSALPNKKGELNGNIYIRGGADPTLGSTRVPGAETYETVLQKWVESIQKMGIKKINGSIIADESLFEGPSIPSKVNWGNIGNYFAAPASPLCFNDNLFTIQFQPQTQGNKLVQVSSISPSIDNLTLKSFVTTDSKTKQDNAYVYGAPKLYDLQIFGTIPTSKKGFTIKGALPDPALFAAQELTKKLKKGGISITQKPYTIAEQPNYESMKLLHTYTSPELKDIIIIVNKRSFNLYAEMLLRYLAVKEGKKGSVENGLAALSHFLKSNKIASSENTILFDGSGLSRDNLLTPQTLVNTLSFMAKSPYFEYYYNSMATPDDRGDLLLLRRFLKPQQKVQQVRVKGGTIDNVKALAGYVYDKNGRLIAFAFMANNLGKKDESLFRIHEDIIKELLESK